MFHILKPYFYLPSANRLQISMPLKTNTVISCKICHQHKACLMTSSTHTICLNFTLFYGQSSVRSHMVEMNHLVFCPLQHQSDLSFHLQFILMTPVLLPGFSCILIRSGGKALSGKISCIFI